MGFDGKKDKDLSCGLRPSDLALWKAMTRDVDPYNSENPYFNFLKEPVFSGAAAQKSQSDKGKTQNKDIRFSSERSKDLDRKTAEKLRKGKLAIEATLDLHGYTQDQAAEAVLRFILCSYDSGKRCLLIVTGKGSRRAGHEESDWLAPAAGILKTRLPDWLNRAEISDKILRFIPAQPKDGGAGAFYVYLRRRRD